MVRKIRRTAGRARDVDVFLGLLPESEPAGDLVRGYALGERSLAYRDLMNRIEGLAIKLQKAWLKVERLEHPAASGDAPQEVQLDEAVRRQQERVCQSLQALEPNDEDLHRLRIEVKGLRYAQDLAGTDAGWAKALQDALGHARDLGLAVEHIGRIRRELHLRHPAVEHRLQAGLDALEGDFQAQCRAQVVSLVESIPELLRQARGCA